MELKYQIDPTFSLTPVIQWDSNAGRYYSYWRVKWAQVYRALSEEIHEIKKSRRKYQSLRWRSPAYINHVVKYYSVKPKVSHLVSDAIADIEHENYVSLHTESLFGAWIWNKRSLSPDTPELFRCMHLHTCHGYHREDRGYHFHHFEWLIWLARSLNESLKQTKESYNEYAQKQPKVSSPAVTSLT